MLVPLFPRRAQAQTGSTLQNPELLDLVPGVVILLLLVLIFLIFASAPKCRDVVLGSYVQGMSLVACAHIMRTNRHAQVVHVTIELNSNSAYGCAAAIWPVLQLQLSLASHPNTCSRKALKNVSTDSTCGQQESQQRVLVVSKQSDYHSNCRGGGDYIGVKVTNYQDKD